MIEPAIVIVRLLQYIGAMILMGSSLFFVYALPRSGAASAAQLCFARPVVAGAATLLAVSSLLSIVAQASLFAGSFTAGLTSEALGAVISYMPMGKAALVRATAASLALVTLLVLSPGQTSWMTAAGLGAVATVSLAWMGHGAATEGPVGVVHLASDILHAGAAAVWVGALAGFVLLGAISSHARAAALHTALRRFSGIGPAVVGVIVITGVANSWILVGIEGVGDLLATPYGRLLALKLLLFVAMLAFAAVNRIRHTAALEHGISGEQTVRAIHALRRSIASETALAVGVLLLVAWLGTLAPPAAG